MYRQQTMGQTKNKTKMPAPPVKEKQGRCERSSNFCSSWLWVSSSLPASLPAAPIRLKEEANPHSTGRKHHSNQRKCGAFNIHCIWLPVMLGWRRKSSEYTANRHNLTSLKIYVFAFSVYFPDPWRLSAVLNIKMKNSLVCDNER